MGNKVTVEVTEQTLYNIDILEDETTVVTVEIPQDIVTVEVSQFTVALELYNSDNDADGQPVFAKSGSDFTLRSFADDDKTIDISHTGPTSELIEIKLPDSGIRVQDAFTISSDSDDTANIVFNGSTIDINGVGDIAVTNLTATNATITNGTVTTLTGTGLDYDSGTIDTLTSTDITTGTIGATTATITTGNITTVNATALNTATLDTTGDATVGGSLTVDVDATITGNVAVTGNITAHDTTLSGNLVAVDVDADTGTIDTLNVVTAEASDEFIGDIRGAVRFRAKAGEALSKGEAVYISGISGNTPVVSRAKADSATTMPAYGLVFADANNNANVEIVEFGDLKGLDTATDSLALDKPVYVSPFSAGGITATRPSAATHLVQNIGLVNRVHQSAGAIKVGGSGRVNDVPNTFSILGDITTAANMSANNITITNDITADDVTATQATITTVNSTTNNATTVNATTVNTTDVVATGDVEALTGSIGTLDGATATYTTLNGTTVNATDVNTTDASITGTATIATGDITTVNSTTINASAINAANLTLTEDITARDGTFSRDVVISGDLTVSGTTTTINTETLELADNNIVLNSNHTGTPTQNGGITIERGDVDDAVFQWNETSDKFEVKVGSVDAVLRAETFEGNLTATQATITTGDITTVNATDVNTTNVDATQIDTTNLDVTTNITTVDIDATGTATIGTLDTTTATIPNLTSTNIDVNGGEIDGTPIGANSHTTGKFTNVYAQKVYVSSDATGLETSLSPNSLTVNEINAQSGRDYVIIKDALIPYNNYDLGTDDVSPSGIWSDGRWGKVWADDADFDGTVAITNLASTNSSTNDIPSLGDITPHSSTVTNSISTLTLGSNNGRWGGIWTDYINANELSGNTNIGGSLIPTTDNAYDLGSSSKKWRSLYLSGGSLFIEGQKVIGSTDGSIDFTTDDDENMTIFAGGSGTQGTMTLGSAGQVTTLQDQTINIGPAVGTGNTYVRNTLNASVLEVGELEISETLFNSTTPNQNLEIRTDGTGYLHANVADFYVGPLAGAVKIDENSIEVIGGDTLTLRDNVDVTGLIKVNDGYTLSSFDPYGPAGLPSTAMPTTIMGIGQEEGWAALSIRSRGEHAWGLTGFGIPNEKPRALLTLSGGRLDGSSDDYLNDADNFGSILFNPYSGYKTGTEWLTPSAYVEAIATEDHSSSGMGTKLVLNTTENGNQAGATDSSHTNKSITIQGTTLSTSDKLKIDDDVEITGQLSSNGSELSVADNLKIVGSGSANTVIGDAQIAGLYDTHGFKINADETNWAGITLEEYVGAGDKPLVSGFANATVAAQVIGGTPSAKTNVIANKRLLTIQGLAANQTDGTLPSTANFRVKGETTEDQTTSNRGTKLTFESIANGSNSTTESLKIQGNEIVINTSGNGFLKSGGDLTIDDDLIVTGSTNLNGNVTLGDANTDVVTATGKLKVSNGFNFTVLDTATANYLGSVLQIVETGDAAYISDGDSGSPCIGVWSGSSWKRIALGSDISSS